MDRGEIIISLVYLYILGFFSDLTGGRTTGVSRSSCLKTEMKVKVCIHYISLIEVIKSRLGTSENVTLPGNDTKRIMAEIRQIYSIQNSNNFYFETEPNNLLYGHQACSDIHYI